MTAKIVMKFGIVLVLGVLGSACRVHTPRGDYDCRIEGTAEKPVNTCYVAGMMPEVGK